MMCSMLTFWRIHFNKALVEVRLGEGSERGGHGILRDDIHSEGSMS